MNGQPWTPEHDKALLQGLGTSGYSWLQKRTGGRSRKALRSRAAKLYGSGITRGAHTLNGTATRTGYSRSHLLRAQAALHQKWKRTAPGGAYLISEEQVDELISWLQHDFWSKAKHRYCCVGCSTESRPSYALGLCRRCYDRYRKDCKQRGLPSRQSGMRAVVAQVLDAVIPENHATFLEEIRSQSGKGLALSMKQLDWLEMLRP